MPIQKCPMCLETKNVVKSHLYPAALYASCRSARGQSPLRVGEGTIRLTDYQVQHPLLCLVCEDVLNKGGETWLNPKLASLPKSFPLHDIVVSGPAFNEDETGAMYFAAENPEVDVLKLTHFALGIFWKASAHSWKGKETKPMIDLGQHAEPIRMWLRDGGEVPKYVYLSVALSRSENVLIVFSGPVPRVTEIGPTFVLFVPGVVFTLYVGEGIDDETKQICLHSNPAQPILVSDEITAAVWERFAQHYVSSRKTRSYLAAREKALKQKA
jgi:hypothetical protein